MSGLVALSAAGHPVFAGYRQGLNSSSADFGLLVQDHVQQRTVDLDVAVVSNKAELSKLIHEKADAGSRRADHLRQRLLTDFSDDRFGLILLAEFCQQEKNAGEPFFTRIKELV